MPREEAFQISQAADDGAENGCIRIRSFIYRLVYFRKDFIWTGRLFFVRPYYETVFAELYEANKQKAYREGYIR